MTKWIPTTWIAPNSANVYDLWIVSNRTGAQQRVPDAQWDMSQSMWLLNDGRFVGTPRCFEDYRVTHYAAIPRGPMCSPNAEDQS